ncbi:MAG TPA: hypothetical protein DHW71_12605 [Gammaproteobacteria bacterium]|nr:hypothetical protein [Gammaproteobacteria bacterium]HCK93830.1 hypothetical protein [Gammaproteobacteria bacterium]|tara:strand:+ start:8848 stop:11940 length:3093 start_codon:yes stop_codon:yes gene_type:complete
MVNAVRHQHNSTTTPQNNPAQKNDPKPLINQSLNNLNMRAPSELITLRIDLNKLNLCDMVVQLEKGLESELKASKSTSALFPTSLSLNEFNETAKNQKSFQTVFQDTLTTFLSAIEKRQEIPESLKKALHQKLNTKSAFYLYGEKLGHYDKSASNNHIKLNVIEYTRALLGAIHSTNTKHIELALKYFPPQPKDLKCIEGTLSRLQSSQQSFDNDAITLKLAPVKSIVSTLSPDISDAGQYLRNMLIIAMQKQHIFDRIHEGNHVHAPFGMMQLLGVNPKLLNDLDTFAQSQAIEVSSQQTDQLISTFHDDTRNFIQESFKLDAAQKNLDDFTRQLELALQLDDQALTECLNSIGQAPIAQLLTPGSAFEDTYGTWDELYMKIESWDYKAIENDLNKLLERDLSLTAPASTEIKTPKPLQRIEQLNQIKQTHNPHEQFLALQHCFSQLLKLNLYKEETIRPPYLSWIKVFMPQEEIKAPKNQLFIDTLRQRLSDLSKTIEHPVNKQLFRNIQIVLIGTAQDEYPFYTQTTHQIYSAMHNHEHGKPLSINDIVTLLQLQLLNKDDAKAHILKQSSNTQALNQQELAHHCSNLSLNRDSNSAHWLNTLSEVVPKVVEQACVEHGLQLLKTKQLKQLQTLLSPPKGIISLAPALLSNDQIHSALPALAGQCLRSFIETTDTDLHPLLLKSAQAKSNLTDYKNEHAPLGAYVVAAQLKKKNPSMAKSLSKIKWPASHFTDDIAQGQNSRLLKYAFTQNDVHTLRTYIDSIYPVSSENIADTTKGIADYLLTHIESVKNDDLAQTFKLLKFLDPKQHELCINHLLSSSFEQGVAEGLRACQLLKKVPGHQQVEHILPYLFQIVNRNNSTQEALIRNLVQSLGQQHQKYDYGDDKTFLTKMLFACVQSESRYDIHSQTLAAVFPQVKAFLQDAQSILKTMSAIDLLQLSQEKKIGLDKVIDYFVTGLSSQESKQFKQYLIKAQTDEVKALPPLVIKGILNALGNDADDKTLKVKLKSSMGTTSNSSQFSKAFKVRF